MLRMIKDNGGDTNFIYHFRKQAVSIAKGPENHKMGQMVGSFHRINNKEQRCLILEPRVGWAFEDWLTGYMAFLVIQSIFSCPQLGLMMRRPRLIIGAGQSCQLPPKQDCFEDGWLRRGDLPV